ncbi:homogentisate 1,2-dioxygenase [Phanerochaete sordida]|uniref:homogentisate 1,2-dioxygenase n=1 Tax=Phanerochaete sordida TaxID=48140 RepID=A0A146GFS8_9APHY|nr:homogentisate 1,2-dioxygenase [Phanerochaete sordida]GJE85535.1 homogentisate 1,2-dioxygenase [Phanerochaete sordida]
MATAQGGYAIGRGKGDPYRYQVGFGNNFASEALPNTLPIGQNNPQKSKYGLYTEGLNGTPFTVPRAQAQHSWLYRVRPSVAHNGFVKAEKQNPYIVAEFSLLDRTQTVTPTQLAWHPHEPPTNEQVNFVYGLKTMMGNGGPMLREGLALHIYACNANMGKEAFVNSDGDFMIVPVFGRLDIQTEFGKMMVFPGEIAVVQRGIKWKVNLPDGKAVGYVQEIFGMHYELPELGPLGASGLANPRDFEHPIAHFDVDQTQWEVTYKLGGKLFTCKQEHTPFDVVAWHGNYIPYKYDLDAFIACGSLTKDHCDPSIFTVLTARSKTTGVALADFAIFKERWDVAEKTFRPPYFHRNTASEILGLVCGDYGGRSDGFVPGALSFETGFCPHGVDNEVFTAASEGELGPRKIQQGALMVMFESSMMMTITEYAMKSDKRHEHEPGMWNGLDAKFLQYKDEIQADLKAAGLPPLAL